MWVEEASVAGRENEGLFTGQFGTAHCELVEETARELHRALPAGLGFPGLAAV